VCEPETSETERSGDIRDTVRDTSQTVAGIPGALKDEGEKGANREAPAILCA
jgi:hypothetical protein